MSDPELLDRIRRRVVDSGEQLDAVIRAHSGIADDTALGVVGTALGLVTARIVTSPPRPRPAVALAITAPPVRPTSPAVTMILPALPVPLASLEISALCETNREPAEIVTLPALPLLPAKPATVIPLAAPAILSVPDTLTVTAPPCP